MASVSWDFPTTTSSNRNSPPKFSQCLIATQNCRLSIPAVRCNYEDCEVPALVGPPVESGAAFLAAHYAGQREVSWCACVSRVRDLIELGPQPDNRIIGDMYFWTRLAQGGPVGCVPRILSHYVLLQPRGQNDNISHGASAPMWAREVRLIADEVIEASRQAGAGDPYVSRLLADSRIYVARSTANQFGWARVRGVPVAKVWSWVPDCLPYLCWNAAVLTRLGAALLLPRPVLHSLLLGGAGRLAEARASVVSSK